MASEEKPKSSGYSSGYLSCKEEGRLPYKLPEQKHGLFNFVDHPSARNQGILWLIRTYITMKKYDEANTIIQAVMKKTDFPNELRGQLEVLHANLFIQQGQYADAIQPLKNAIILTKNKKLRTRYIFILAQLYQKMNDANASKQFAYVLKGDPSIAMEFYAKLYSAYTFEGNTQESYYKIIAMLQQMAQNKKYDDYYDQIYYAIATIYEKEGNTKKAVENYQLAARKSTTNPMQKGKAYVAIGNIYFKQELYKPAKFAYDSALQSLKPDYDSLNVIKERHTALTDLIKNLNIIQREDSVQKIANMSDKDREAYVEDLRKKIEKQKEEEEQEASQSNNLLNTTTQQNNNSTAGGWYFYNVAAKGQGYNQFIQVWGKRVNEDNWRRSNKASVEPEDLSTAGIDSTASDTSKSGKNDLKKTLLSGIPLTDEKMKASVDRIVKAYYEVADIYNNQLHNQPKAIETLNELLARYPQNSQLLPVWYQLYIMNKDQGNMAEANRYKDSIGRRFPNSDIYKIINDPNYINTLNQKQNELNTFYASTYNDYLNDDYSTVFQRTRQADSLFKPNPLQAKFDLLNAFCIGQIQTKDSMKTQLIKFIKKYPSGEEYTLAMQVLKDMGYGKDSTKVKHNKDSLTNLKKTIYKYMPNEAQQVVMVFSSVDPRVKSINDSLVNFNNKSHSSDNLNTTTALLNTTRQMIIIKSFTNAAKAIAYYNEIKQQQGIIDIAKQLNYKLFVMDSKDYMYFYNSKDVDGYNNFFQSAYLSH